MESMEICPNNFKTDALTAGIVASRRLRSSDLLWKAHSMASTTEFSFNSRRSIANLSIPADSNTLKNFRFEDFPYRFAGRLVFAERS
jgi:hypothetical protein